MTDLRSPDRRPPHHHFADAARRHDPTQTAGLRRGYRADAQMRLRRLRGLMRQALTEYDILGLGSADAPNFSTPTTRLRTFLAWFEAEADMSLCSPWHQPWTERAYRSGALKAAGEVKLGSNSIVLPPADTTNLHAVAQTELKGIAAALAQHVGRGALYVASRGARPSIAHRFLVKPFDKIAKPRLNAFANFMAVKSHNAAKIDVFRSRGVRQVGIAPELFKARKPITDADDDDEQVNIETAGDAFVCAYCQDIADGGPYDLDEAMDLIPAHANCRCAVMAL